MKIKLHIQNSINKLGVSFVLFLSVLFLYQCQPKGPISFPNKLIGESKDFLIQSKGKPTTIKRFDDRVAFIYVKKEEYYGKKTDSKNLTPKTTYSIEYIYYIDNKNIVYKYQVWKKKLK